MTSKQNMNEENNIQFATPKGIVDINDVVVRENVNTLLARATHGKFVTPYIALERVSKVLANYHIFLGRKSFLPGESGMVVWPVEQFGVKIGFDTKGYFVKMGETEKDMSKGPHAEGEETESHFDAESAEREPEEELSVYFEWRQSDCGMYDIFCEVVDEDELDEILADIEAELNDEGEEEDEDELNEQLDEGVGKVTKKIIKNIKRGLAGWPDSGSDYNDPEKNKPRDVVRRAKQLTKDDPDFARSIADDKVRKGSPADLQRRVIKKHLGKVNEEQIDEISAELVGKVNKARLDKPAKTDKADQTRNKAVLKAWLNSKVGELKKSN